MSKLIAVKLVSGLFSLFLTGAGLAHAEELTQKFSDSAERSLEAGSVELILDDAGRVVEVRVADCELCDRSSYLPRRNIEVEVAGEDLSKEDFPDYSGMAGTIVFHEKDYMIFGVYYWVARAAEENR